MSYAIFSIIYGLTLAVGIIIGRQTVIERIETSGLSLPNLCYFVEKRQRIKRRIIAVCSVVIFASVVSIVNSLI